MSLCVIKGQLNNSLLLSDAKSWNSKRCPAADMLFATLKIIIVFSTFICHRTNSCGTVALGIVLTDIFKVIRCVCIYRKMAFLIEF